MSAGTLLAVKTVLVADDTAFVRDRFRSALEAAGHRALTVRTAAEVVATLKEAPLDIDLIVLDLRLPDTKGGELLKAIRKVAPESLRIVAFSGTIASAEEVREFTSLGVSGYLNEYTTSHHIVPSLAPHLFPDNFNRRSSPRVTTGVPIAYRFGNTIAAALTINISKGGVAIRTSSPLEAGTDVKIRFRLPAGKKDIEAEAKVAWSNRRIGMGLQFTRIDEGDEAAIEEFALAHFFSNRRA